MPEKEPVQPDADAVAAELKELGIEGKDAQSPVAQQCARILVDIETDLRSLLGERTARVRDSNLGTNYGKGFGVFETVDEV